MFDVHRGAFGDVKLNYKVTKIQSDPLRKNGSGKDSTLSGWSFLGSDLPSHPCEFKVTPNTDEMQ